MEAWTICLIINSLCSLINHGHCLKSCEIGFGNGDYVIYVEVYTNQTKHCHSSWIYCKIYIYHNYTNVVTYTKLFSCFPQTIKFKSYLLSMGIPNPVTRDTHGSGDKYYTELARQLSNVLEKPLKVRTHLHLSGTLIIW